MFTTLRFVNRSWASPFASPSLALPPRGHVSRLLSSTGFRGQGPVLGCGSSLSGVLVSKGGGGGGGAALGGLEGLGLSSLFGSSLFSGGRGLHTSSMSLKEEDLYKIMGVPRDASAEDIKKKYKEHARDLHPDRNKSPDAAQKFADVNMAYTVLGDKKKRAQYDATGSSSSSFSGGGPGGRSGGGFDGNDIFSHFADIFGGGGLGGAAERGPRKGQDIQVGLLLSFMEAVNGVTKKVSYKSSLSCKTCDGSGARPGTSKKSCSTCRGSGIEVTTNGWMQMQTTCRSCRGAGQTIESPCGSCSGAGTVRESRTVEVTVPAGVDSGMNIRLPGMGDAGTMGGPPGHLYAEIRVQEDDVFLRDGPDVNVLVPLTIGQATLGDTVLVPTLTGEVELTVPKGTQSDDVHVLRNKGIVKLNTKKHGNLYVHFKIVTPTELTPEQEELMKKFRDLEKAASSGKSTASGSFFSSALNKLKKSFKERMSGGGGGASEK